MATGHGPAGTATPQIQRNHATARKSCAKLEAPPRTSRILR